MAREVGKMCCTDVIHIYLSFGWVAKVRNIGATPKQRIGIGTENCEGFYHWKWGGNNLNDRDWFPNPLKMPVPISFPFVQFAWMSSPRAVPSVTSPCPSTRAVPIAVITVPRSNTRIAGAAASNDPPTPRRHEWSDKGKWERWTFGIDNLRNYGWLMNKTNRLFIYLFL